MDFMEHTIPVRIACAQSCVPGCWRERQNKTHDHTHSTRSPTSFSSSPNIPVCSCMKDILQPFIGCHSLLCVAAFLLHLPCCDSLRSSVYREEERWFCHWLPRGRPHWSIWPNCAKSPVWGEWNRSQTLVGQQEAWHCRDVCLNTLRCARCTSSMNYHFELVLIRWDALFLAISNPVCKLARG